MGSSCGAIPDSLQHVHLLKIGHVQGLLQHGGTSVEATGMIVPTDETIQGTRKPDETIPTMCNTVKVKSRTEEGVASSLMNDSVKSIDASQALKR